MSASEDDDTAGRRPRTADAATVLLDGDGVVTGWTAEAQRLLGYAPDEAVGRAVADLVVPADTARLPGPAGAGRDADGGWAGALTVRHRDGHTVRLTVRAAPVPDGPGPVRWVVLAGPAGAPGSDLPCSVLDQLVAGSPVGMAVLDTGLRYVWSNAALEQFGGGPAARRAGRRIGEVQPGLDAEGLEAVMRRVLETGEPVRDHEHVGRLRSAPYRETAHLMSFIRLVDERGRPLGVSYTVVDMTERYRARRRLALLDRAGEVIGARLDVTGTAQALADVAVPELADFVAVDLLDPVLQGGEPPASLEPGPAPDRVPGGRAVPLRRAGQRSAHPEEPEAAVPAGHLVPYRPDSPPARCLSEGTSWWERRLGPLAGEWAAGAPDGRPALPGPGPHSALVVPVRARGCTLGVAVFLRRGHQDPFDAEDVGLAEELVARAAVWMDNARRYTRERDAALVLQRSLLPYRIPERAAVDAAARYRPADALAGVGGDWYDLIPLSGARVAMVVGEVVGHGIEAAAAMGRLRAVVQTLADLDLPPVEVLAHADDLVARGARELDAGPGTGGPRALGATCLYVVYNPVTGHCAMASAGHPPPVVVAPDGTVWSVRMPVGPPLGVGGPPFESVGTDLPEGSVLALYTDGMLAADGGPAGDADHDRGRERLRAALAAHARRPQPLERWCEALMDDLVPERPADDAALLLARTHRLAGERVVCWELAADPSAVPRARRETVRRLAQWGLDELTFPLELVVSELVTNAVNHATGPIRLRLIRDRSLICEVSDASATAPHLKHPRVTDEGGRGLFLISRFTERWGTRYTSEGKVIWTEQSLAEPDGPDAAGPPE
ncbi:SpoIIE family protein phosphatase [Streptomyces minutiscleroticus]|uniref:PAS domain-containing protein n=1 Tax=Streptomyces minutiscleroticus TaxID=68238 RepID=A0A918NQC2_9ACTN|nr:SpoIIE family protein phosphatase [Streptomyces minutiscleroticus]GGX86822.1 hypothetical protein GCM10010358_46090 [Streptomyces minutiscleroticus]